MATAHHSALAVRPCTANLCSQSGARGDLPAVATSAACLAPSQRVFRSASTGWSAGSSGRNGGSSRIRRVLKCAAEVFDVKAVDVAQVRPQADRLLVKLEEAAQKSAGGVLLPSSAVKFDRHLVGEVISVGPEAKSATPGQKVMFSDLNAYEVSLGSGTDKLCFVRDGDLLAVVS